MKLWILLAVVLLLLAVALGSESFSPTSTIKAPPYDDTQKRRMYGMLSTTSQSKLKAKVKADNPTLDDFALTALAGGSVAEAVGGFYTAYYAPLERTLKPADVDAFMAGRTGDAETKALETEAITAYFLNQSGPHSSGYLDTLAGLGQTWRAGAPTGPTGPAAVPAGGSTGPVGEPAAPAAPAGPTGPTEPAGGGSTGATGGTSIRGTPTTTGGSTSGSATTVTSAPTQGLFGPQFTSFGEPSPSGSTLDSSKYTSYPQVLGGVPDRSTTTVPGAGVISGPRTLELPTMESLGASAASQYFPFSRTPGDLERIPDPYRVSQMFSSASYSSKTEPVPFLSDFSAFQR